MRVKTRGVIHTKPSAYVWSIVSAQVVQNLVATQETQV